MSGPNTTLIDLNSKRIIITGASSGLGKECALALSQLGAQIVLAVRNTSKGEKVLTEIKNQVPNAKIEVSELDLTDFESIRNFCARENNKQIDILLNNAGIMAVPFALTKDGFESQMGTNHLGHFLLTSLLFENINRSNIGRIINVSSTAHRLGKLKTGSKSEILMTSDNYSPWVAYGNSKLANLLFTSELSRRLKLSNSKVITASSHPGYAATNLQLVGPSLKKGLRKTIELNGSKLANILFGQSAARGALPSIAACNWSNIESNDFLGPDGPMQARGNPKKVNMSSLAKNSELAKNLWLTSEELTGVKFLNG